MVNPCVVKGVSIFLALADRFPNVEFAALEGWGTTDRDRAALAERSNVRLMHTVANIEDALARATCLLVPSVWYEGFGLIAMEAMLRGLPVIASNSGGLEEAKRGTGYVVPVRPVERYEMSFDDTGMPRAIVPEQDIDPWAAALQTLLTDETAYWEEAKRSREAALRFVSGLDAADFENYLVQLKPYGAPSDIASRLAKLDPQQRARLLAQLRAKRGKG
jgi:glycosyltransferase involved in cell wall biosynthesis